MSGIFGAIFKAIFGSLISLVAGWLQRRKLVAETKRADTAETKVAQQEQVIQNAGVRHDIDSEVESKPEAPAQRVADAVPGTAASELRDDWSRD